MTPDKDKPIRVLLVEDSPGDARLVREFLANAGGHMFVVEHVDRLDAAIERLQGGELPDVILLDLGLQDSRGFDTFASIQEWAQDLSIIMLTGHDDEELAMQLVRAGAQDYLLKSEINGTLLTRTVRYALERKSAELLLRSSDAKFASALRSCPDAVTISRLADGRFVEVNDGFCRMTGVSRKDAIGSNAVSLGLWQRAEDRDAIVDILRSNGRVNSRECLLRSKSGKEIAALISSEMVHVDGEPHIITIATDISERKKAERTLQLTQFAFEQAVDSVFWVDAVDCGRLLNVNQAACDNLGYTREELLQLSVHDIVEDLRTPEECSRLAETLRELGVYRFESRQQRNDGSTFPVEITANYLNHEGEDLFVAYVRDITDRVRSERDLRESEERFRLLFEYAPDAYFLCDRESVFIDGNRAIEELTGFSRSELTGKTLLESGVLLPTVASDITHLFGPNDSSNSQRPSRICMQHKDESLIFAEIRTVPLVLKGEYLELVIARDVTEAVTAQEASRASEQSYRDVVEHATVGIYRSSVDGRFLTVNPALVEMLGYDSAEDLLGLHLGEDVYVDSSERDRQIAVHAQSDIITSTEGTWKCRDGEVITVRETGRVLRKGTGKVDGFEMFVEDITERRRLAGQLRQAQKMEAIGTLAGCIAHDFNNLLQGILGYTDLARLETPDINPARGYLDEVWAAGNRAADLVDRILRFSRESKEVRRPIQVQDSVQEVVSLLRPSLPSTIELRSDISAECRPIVADPTEIHQAIMNLCTNAYHAMRERAGILEIKLDDVLVDAELAKRLPKLVPGSCARLTVSDTGIGMDEDTMTQIFDLYFTTKKPGCGTGLGLTTSLRIAEDCGGSIAVSSKLGEGTTFEMYLPYADSPTAGPDRKPCEVSVPPGTERILFVDDEEILVDLGKVALERYGYSVEGCTKSIEALERFCSDPHGFDLVITDMTMPHMTGIDLANRLLQSRSDTPVILCTGFSELVDNDRATEAGIRAFVNKPVTSRNLAAIVRRVLDGGGPEAASAVPRSSRSPAPFSANTSWAKRDRSDITVDCVSE